MPYARVKNELPIIPGYASGDIVSISDALTDSPVNTLTAGVSGSGCNVVKTGFNLWDEQWVLGQISTTTGEIIAGDRVVSKNHIKVAPNTSYYFTTGVAWIFLYDGNKNLISYTQPNANRLVTTHSNCAFLMFYTSSTYGATYNNDICVNVSDTNKNGDYEPYKSVTYPITFPSSVISGSITINADGTVDLTSGTTTRLDDTVDIRTYYGANNIWVDTGDIENLVYVRRNDS